MLLKRRSNISNALMGLVFVLTFFSLGSSSGITGLTLKNSNSEGCSCHGGQNGSVSVVIDGPASLAPGATGNYTVTITGGPLSKGGTNIAATSGTLANADNSLKTVGTELTHTSAKAASGGKVTFAFKYTAPANTGAVTLFANGNSVNGNGGSSGDQWNFAANKTIDVTTVGVDEDASSIKGFALQQNYPNPFNPATQIQFAISTAGNYSLKVFTPTGEEVATLFEKEFQTGNHTVSFNAASLPSGIYLYKLTGNGFTATKKMLLTK